MLLADRVCLITGGSRGIGLEIARRFAGQGAKVILTGRSEDGVRTACADVTSVGTGECHGLTCDVGDPKSVKSAFQQVHSKFRRLDVLVANAGILEGAYISMVTEDQIDRTFSTNTFGLLYCAQYAARLMARSGGGSMITMSSIVGVAGFAGQVVYAGSKAAVIGITKSLSRELASQSVRVNAIAPGYIETDMTQNLPAEKRAQVVAGIQMKRPGQPIDVANVALFLASDLSAYVTGQVIGVDGGLSF